MNCSSSCRGFHGGLVLIIRLLPGKSGRETYSLMNLNRTFSFFVDKLIESNAANPRYFV